MKVLFVSSGNAKEGISSIIKNQGLSLIKQNVNVVFFTIKGKGFWAYFKHIFILKKLLKKEKFDVVHAHYSFSAFVASLAGVRTLVISLMGSDVISSNIEKIIVYAFALIFRWKQIIVKSADMRSRLNFKKEITIIPNGVNLDIFKPMEKKIFQEKLGWDITKKHILFAANPKRKEKNFNLAIEAKLILNDPIVELHVLDDVANNDMPNYMNAADVVLLCSKYEGSPNVIKEAMACNLPIVSTNVGDVKLVLGKTQGCFISSFEPYDVAKKLKYAIEYDQRTTGRDRIIEIGLDSEAVANKIIEIYKKI